MIELFNNHFVWFIIGMITAGLCGIIVTANRSAFKVSSPPVMMSFEDFLKLKVKEEMEIGDFTSAAGYLGALIDSEGKVTLH